MQLQKAVVRKGTNIIENKKVVPHGVFRCVTLTNLSETDMLTFTQPLALSKLARFVVNAFREQGTWSKLAKPLVVLALNKKRKVYSWRTVQRTMGSGVKVSMVHDICMHRPPDF